MANTSLDHESLQAIRDLNLAINQLMQKIEDFKKTDAPIWSERIFNLSNKIDGLANLLNQRNDQG